MHYQVRKGNTVNKIVFDITNANGSGIVAVSLFWRVSPLPQDTINNVKSRLGKSVQIQTVLRAFEARDRNLQESNFDRVNFWSVVNLVVMMVVSAVQVYLVRSLFEDKRKIRT